MFTALKTERVWSTHRGGQPGFPSMPMTMLTAVLPNRFIRSNRESYDCVVEQTSTTLRNPPMTSIMIGDLLLDYILGMTPPPPTPWRFTTSQELPPTTAGPVPHSRGPSLGHRLATPPFGAGAGEGCVFQLSHAPPGHGHNTQFTTSLRPATGFGPHPAAAMVPRGVCRNAAPRTHDSPS